VRGLSAICLILLVFLEARLAHAQDVNRDLQGAAAALLQADYAGARALAAPWAARPDLPPAEAAEAQRIAGLAAYALGDREPAEAAVLAYLQLVPDAHLDPALYPPELVVFLEDVRTRHAGELLLAKPRPKRRKSFFVNLVPPLGQLQNGDRARAWVFGSLEVALLATNVGTYAALRADCADDQTCHDPGRARTLRTVNLVAAGLLAGVWVAGVVDGFVGYPEGVAEEPPPRWGFVPTVGGAVAQVSGRF
jgi:hypothetical protein